MRLIRITVIAWLGVLCFGFSAMADNPAIWNFDLETYGSRDDWYSARGSGTTGPSPISNMLVYPIDEPEIVANIFVSVDSSGYGNIYIDDITFGQAQGYDVTGMRCSGQVTITPEPATICLLGLGGLALRRRRRA